MSKILIIGVGGGGRNTVQRMKEIGIPDANYITFGAFREDYANGEFKQATPNSDVPHYNLITMNGFQNMPCTHNPKVFAELAENAKDQIRAVLENSFNKDANGLISKDAIASIDGLYLIECLGDNHTFCELYKYRKRERIWKYFEDEYEHSNGRFVVKPINIINIVLETDTEWKQRETAPAYGGLYIVAYAFQNDAEAYYGYHSTYGTTETQLSIQYDKKNYALIYAAQGENFRDRLINLVKLRGLKSKDDEMKWENARVLAHYIVRDDSDVISKYFAVQETEDEKKGLFSRIIHFIGRVRKMYHIKKGSLFIGVGGGGRNTVQRMKEIGIPDANYITFGAFREDCVNGEFKQALPYSDVPHYNLITMNGLNGISNTDKPKVFAELAENVKDQIKENNRGTLEIEKCFL